MIAVIQDQNTVNGWFLIDNSNPTDSQDYLKRNQTLVEQIQNIHGILGKHHLRKSKNANCI